MPDITMCQSSKCRYSKFCYRFGAKPSQLQSYADFYKEGEECKYFISNYEEIPSEEMKKMVDHYYERLNNV